MAETRWKCGKVRRQRLRIDQQDRGADRDKVERSVSTKRRMDPN